MARQFLGKRGSISLLRHSLHSGNENVSNIFVFVTLIGILQRQVLFKIETKIRHIRCLTINWKKNISYALRGDIFYLCLRPVFAVAVMIKKSKTLLYLSLVASLCFCPKAFAESELDLSAEGYDGISRAASDVELSFVQPGKIREILVKEGDLVDVGDIVIRQADELEAAQLKILQSRSKNMLPIHLAEIDLRQKRKDLEHIKSAAEQGAINKWEVDHAILAVETAQLTMRIREFEHDQDVLQLESIIESIKRLTLASPLAGSVEEIMVEEGETVQALNPVIRIVRIDPLQIDLPVPVDRAKTLKPGQDASIGFPDGTKQSGKILKIASIADAAATTLEVKLEIPNPEKRPAGERVKVTFPDKDQ